MTSARQAPSSELLRPRYWPTWALLGLMRAVVHLPHPALLAAGALIGRLYGRLVPYRRHIVERNLELCFPELTTAQRRRRTREALAAIGIGLVETLTLWWRRFDPKGRLGWVEGAEQVQHALHRGRGVLLVSAHFTSFEISGRYIQEHFPLCVTYQPLRNRVFDWVMRRGRGRVFQQAIARDDLRGLVRALRANRVVWYAPDQDAGRHGTVFAPFFGIQAATLTATSRLARLSGAPVFMYVVRRTASIPRYHVAIRPIANGFPSGSPELDAALYLRAVEAAVRLAPEQYFWNHRRFKTRPPGQPRLYPPKPRRLRARMPRVETLSEPEVALPAGSGATGRWRDLPPGTSARDARRQCRKAIALRRLGLLVPLCRRIVYDPVRRAYHLELQVVPGRPLRALLTADRADETEWRALARLLAELHAGGVYKPSMDLGEIWRLPGHSYALPRLDDVEIGRRPVTIDRRARNLATLAGHDGAALQALGLARFLTLYEAASSLSLCQRARLRRALTSWAPDYLNHP